MLPTTFYNYTSYFLIVLLHHQDSNAKISDYQILIHISIFLFAIFGDYDSSWLHFVTGSQNYEKLSQMANNYSGLNDIIGSPFLALCLMCQENMRNFASYGSKDTFTGNIDA